MRQSSSKKNQRENEKKYYFTFLKDYFDSSFDGGEENICGTKNKRENCNRKYQKHKVETYFYTKHEKQMIFQFLTVASTVYLIFPIYPVQQLNIYLQAKNS